MSFQRIKPTKPKMCKVCRKNPIFKIGAKVCGAECATAFAVSDRAKQERIEAKRQAAADRKKLEDLRPRKWWLKKAKTALHAYIRLRDEGKECISCDTVLARLGRVGGDYDAGHFRSVGSAKHLEFVEANIHGQCKHCNDFLGSNAQEYERRLRLRFSDEFVENLLNDNAPRKLTIEDFKSIESKYKQKFKELTASKTKP